MNVLWSLVNVGDITIVILVILEKVNSDLKFKTGRPFIC